MTPPPPRVIVLLGPPGAGKTYLARRIQASLGFAYEETERALLERYGSREAFVQDKSRALAALEAELRTRVAASPVPVVIEATGWSDGPMLARLRQEFPLLLIKVYAERELCTARVQSRETGRNLSNDPQQAATFHDLWLREVAPRHSFDLEVLNDGNREASFLEELARRVEPGVRRAPPMGGSMQESVDARIVELLEWIGDRPRAYAEVVDAWRTSCPRLPVWEEANQRGFLAHQRDAGGVSVVCVSAAGRELIEKQRRKR